MKKLKKVFIIILCLVLAASAGIAWELHRSKYGLMTSYYEIPLRDGVTVDSQKGTQSGSSQPGAGDGFRVVQLTDLHSSVFGEDNCELVDVVTSATPDLILITGDMVNDKQGVDTSVAVSLIEQLVEITPVYVSYGNQESNLEQEAGLDFRQIYGDAGATVLERDYVDVQVNGYKLRIGGFYGYGQMVRYYEENDRFQWEIEYLKEFQDTDAYKLLMCHMPALWADEDSLYDYNVDCVLSGHAHGGQVRIPFIGGLWAPDQGMFPGRECGIYETNEARWMEYVTEMQKKKNETEDGTDPFNGYYDGEMFQNYTTSYMVLSRGLGNTDKIPRFNNVPEVVIIDYK